jgi:hypothetical protein
MVESNYFDDIIVTNGNNTEIHLWMTDFNVEKNKKMP